MAYPMTFATTLMSHQKQAVDKLKHVKVGALYMDMGTGKTRTALELGMRRLVAGKVDSILWLCPVSVKTTIVAEILKHLPDATYEVVRPGRIKKENAHIYIAGIESLSASDALNLTLYDWVTRKRVFLVCDESILIKNHRAQRTLAIWRLSERCSYRLLLNGTPISNNEKDLYAQWYFLDPRILGYTSFYKFAANHLEYDDFRRVRRALNVDYLVAKMAPYLYQVRKDECLDLPQKSYSQFYCTMSSKQREIYDMAKERHLIYAADYGFTDVAIYRMFGELQRVLSGVTAESTPIYSDPRANPRISLLLEVIEQLPSDTKVIIWCRYTHEIESISTLLRQDYGAESVAQFWGEIKEKRRSEEIERFRSGARFFVANKQCGGYGLNLQHCQYAIYYSNDFSWAARIQSEDRIHRLGQAQNVHIIDIVCLASIDELIQRALSRKQKLVDVFRETITDQKDKNQIAQVLDERKEG